MLQRLANLFRTPGADPPPAPQGTPPAGPAPELRRAVARILETVEIPVALVDPALRLVAWNPSLATLSGCPAGTLEGRPVTDLLDDAGHEWIRRQCQAGMAGRAGARLGRVTFGLPPGTDVIVTGSRFLERGEHRGWYLRFTPNPDIAFGDPSMHGLVERVRREKERLAALLTVSHALVNSLDLDIILATIAQQVREVIAVDECTVFLLDPATQILTPVVCDAERFRDEMMAMRLRVGEGITGTVALNGRGEIVDSAEDDPRAAQVPGTPPEQSALMCVPMIARERVVGVITLARLGPRSFDRSDLELATLFAAQCSAALANARVYDELRIAYDELRETQAQLVQSEKVNALGEMAAGVAHDFNNILAAILGRTELMLRDVRDPHLRRQLAIVHQAAVDGAHAVRRVQEFTRIRHDETFTPQDPNTLLADVIELTRMGWEADARERGVTIRVHGSFHAVQHVLGNASELREVITNLILNAVDAMPEGGDLYVSSADHGDEVVIRLRDTGLGMDAQTQNRIFDPFFTTKSAKGTGLGLSVAYGIVTRHRGSIAVASQPGAGAEFVLRFPRCDAPRGTSDVPPVAPGIEPRRILVVDDEEPVAGVLAEMLRGLGHEVVVAIGGPAGLAEFERSGADIVFSDLGMAEVSGWDLAAAVKARRPGTRVVLVTGWGSQIETGTARERGVDVVLPKPFSIEDVERVLAGTPTAPGARSAAA